MISPINIATYISMLLASTDKYESYGYCVEPYTTSYIITNSDMCDLNKLNFIQEEE